MLSTLALLALCGGVLGEELKITDVTKFIEFSNNVNSGIDYTNTTVFLETDIDLTGHNFVPIGTEEHYFNGIFDGKGHSIKNLLIDTNTIQYVGLFGFVESATIKNVMIDSTCSFVSGYNQSQSIAHVASLVGACYEPCILENNVNFASVTYAGDTDTAQVGGIVGYMLTKDGLSHIKNCANYATITSTGLYSQARIGGIAGFIYGPGYVRNCLSYGDFDAKTVRDGATCRLGGIVGSAEKTLIDNCVSAGAVNTATNNADNAYFGGVVGVGSQYLTVTNCYWSDKISKNALGSSISSTVTVAESSSFGENLVLNMPVKIGQYKGTSLSDAVNAYAMTYYVLRDCSEWIVNKNELDVKISINNEEKFAVNYKVILLPALASEAKLWFDGWYVDDSCETKLTVHEIENATDLYGKFEENTEEYTIDFRARNGIAGLVESIKKPFATVVKLPDAVFRSDCIFSHWENEYGDAVDSDFVIPAHDLTLYAVQVCSRIASNEEFVEFARIVNARLATFELTTVFLDTNVNIIDQEYEPISGDSEYYGFLGTFDGQGHTIAYKMDSATSRYFGVFGYSYGITVKNLVISEMTSVVSSYKSDELGSTIYMGAVVGFANSKDVTTRFENVVNMGQITFAGNVSESSVYMGGIAGNVVFDKMPHYVKNCANYGRISFEGVGLQVYMGGIVGHSHIDNNKRIAYYRNCYNDGELTFSGKADNIYIGGISGESKDNVIENCVNYGKIEYTGMCYFKSIGSIVGDLRFSSVSNCYWSDENTYKAFGFDDDSVITANASFNKNFELEKSVAVGDYMGTSLIEALNAACDYYDMRDYSHWVINKNERLVGFIIDEELPMLTLESKIILLPTLTDDGKMWFNGWYTDDMCTSKFEAHEIEKSAYLYARYEENKKSYVISFDTKGGKPVGSISAQFGTSVNLPTDVTKDNCTFMHWETKSGDKMEMTIIMPDHSTTFYAVWLCTVLKTAEDLIDFADIVNSDISNFKGTTVYLANDIDLKGATMEPIGNGKGYYSFIGTFDGKGHTISNGIIQSDAFVGLFGTSEGATIKNVILDSTCTVINSGTPSSTYMGGIIGHCVSHNSPCIIEDCINKAEVSFYGDETGVLKIGGIVGYLRSSTEYMATLKRCNNHGPVTHSGYSYGSYIGGIIGESFGASNVTVVHVQNCDNYGRISHKGKSYRNSVFIDGIVAEVTNTNIEECKNYGKVSAASSIHILSVAWVLFVTFLLY